MANLTLQNFGQSGNCIKTDKLNNFLSLGYSEEMNDAASAAVNGGIGLQDLVSYINSNNSNSQALIGAVVSEVPKEPQSITTDLAAGLTKGLNQASDDFN